MDLRGMAALVLVALTAGCAAETEEEESASTTSEISAETLTLRVDFEKNAQASRPDASDAERERESIHLGNAYWLAKLSDYAYWPPTVIQQQLQNLRANAREFHFFSNSCTGAQAYYVALPQGAVLAFRGSDAIAQDWVETNGNSVKVGWDGPGQVHAGFLRQLESLWNGETCGKAGGSEGGALGAYVMARHGWDASGQRRGLPLYVTGHSLGGALATMFLARVQADACKGAGCTRPPAVPVSGLYTYASPKVGSESFATTVAVRARKQTPIYRIVYGDDPVTFFPRNLAPELTNYRHVGYPTFFGESSLQVWIKDKEHLRIAETVVRGPWRGGDHGLPPYIDTLKALARSKQQL